MGMDLSGAGGDFGFTQIAWKQVLALGRLYGWIPAGTTPPVYHDPNDEPWDGGYEWNSGQGVIAPDALALAGALERALDDVPDDIVSEHQMHDATGPVAEAIRHAIPDARVVSYGPASDTSPVAFWRGPDGKKYLQAFIAYCRAGEFCIF